MVRVRDAQNTTREAQGVQDVCPMSSYRRHVNTAAPAFGLAAARA
jgi:hypothetical protein